MKQNLSTVLRRLAAAGMCVWLAAGCSTTAMKGTPFYTGEYATRKGSVENRVNLWPLAYYRDPALSILWPLGEYTGDRFAIRPIFSIENLDKEDPVYNVLWPLGRFDTCRGDNRLFPFFWGRDYRVAFPLYWHYDQPLGREKGSDSLFPLWLYFRDHEQYSLHLLWPFFNVKSYDDERGWRVWPLAGHYERPKARRGYTYALWPLAWHEWSDNDKEESWALLPIFQASHTPHEKSLQTLLGGWRRDVVGMATDWWALPILGGGHHSPAESRAYGLLGLYGHHRNEASHGSRLLPLYYHKATAKSDLFLSPLYLSGSTAEAGGWTMVPPLVLHRHSKSGSAFYSLLYSQGADRGKDERWSCLLPLYYHKESVGDNLFLSPLYLSRTTPDAGWRLVPPLAFYRHSGNASSFYSLLYSQGADCKKERNWSCLLPFYYAGRDPQGSSFVTALGGWWRGESGRTWIVYPLLSGGRRRADGGELWVGGPLFHASWDVKGRSHWLLPLYAYDHTDDSFLSLPYSSWSAEDDRTVRLFPFLLSSYTRDAARWDLWTLGGLGHFSGGAQGGSSHLIPLYYGNRRTGTWVSPLYATWAGGSGHVRCIPPLLSGWSINNDHRTESFASPLYAFWKEERGSRYCIPPLLSAYSRHGNERSIIGLLGLFHARWGGHPSRRTGRLLPLYYYDDELLLTPLVGSLKDGGTTSSYWLTPLFGTRTGSMRGSWLFPIYSHSSKPEFQTSEGSFLLLGDYSRSPQEDETSFPLLFKHERWCSSAAPAVKRPRGSEGWRFNALLLAHGESVDYTHTRRVSIKDKSGTPAHVDVGEPMHRGGSGLFPLWNYKSNHSTTGNWERASGNLLLALFDYKRERGRTLADQQSHDYARWRVLYRLYHHERLNGATSIDIFPAITIDRDPAAGKRKVSFLWRLFRYERTPEGCDVDLLFLPVWRGGGRGDGESQ
jgi:hypothetical protein